MGTSKKDFPVWKTIEVGACCSVEEIFAGCDYENRENGRFNRLPGKMHSGLMGSTCLFEADELQCARTVSLSRVRKEVDLVLIWPRGTGISGRGIGAYRRVCKWAMRQGLQLCDHEDALYLRRVYGCQPWGESLYMFLKKPLQHKKEWWENEMECFLDVTCGGKEGARFARIIPIPCELFDTECICDCCYQVYVFTKPRIGKGITA